MTIPAKTAWGSAVGSGITGPYAVPFPLYSQSDLTILTVVNNVPTTLALGTDYTFTTWTPDNKGEVALAEITFTNVVAGGTLIIFLLFPAGTQLTSITNQYAYFPSLHEMTFDRLCQMSLMLLQWAQKTIKAPDQEQAGTSNLTLPPAALRATQLIGTDANGNIVMYPISTGSGLQPVYVASTQSALPNPSVVGSPALAYTQDIGQYFGWNTVTQTWEGLI